MILIHSKVLPKDLPFQLLPVIEEILQRSKQSFKVTIIPFYLLKSNQNIGLYDLIFVFIIIMTQCLRMYNKKMFFSVRYIHTSVI